MQGSPSAQSVLEALNQFSRGLDSLFSNANDCHDESGRFCEGSGGSSGARPSGISAKASRPSVPRFEGPGVREHAGVTDPMERASIDHLRIAQGKEPVDWIGVDANAHQDRLAAEAKRASRNGISPQASISAAERKGKEYGYSKKVSFYQCTDVDQANEINAQMAELSDDSGLELERVYVYKSGGRSKEAPKNSAGYHQGSTKTIGIQNGQTAAYCFKNAPYAPGAQEENARWFADYADKMEKEPNSDPDLVKAFRRQGEEALKYKDYQAHTVQGNGVRNPTVDHEFAHALVTRAQDAAWERPVGSRNRIYASGRIEGFAKACREFAGQEKFSVYAMTGYDYNDVPTGEALAETYAYWKSGKTVPDHIAKGLRRLETYRGPGTGT